MLTLFPRVRLSAQKPPEPEPVVPAPELSIAEAPIPQSIAENSSPSEVFTVEPPAVEILAKTHSDDPAIVESPMTETPADETPILAEANSEILEVESRNEELVAIEEPVLPEKSISVEETPSEAIDAERSLVVVQHPEAHADVAGTEQLPLGPDTPLLEAAAAAKVSSLESSGPHADAPPAEEESPALGSGIREKPRPNGSGLLDLPRVAEPEVMEDSEEVEAYASAAAQSWLDTIDDSFVEHAARLVKGRQRGRALDIGTGPGRIALKLALRLSLWKLIGVDRSQKMIDEALANLAATAPVTGRLEFQVADGNRLDYPDASFDLVICNSVLHHFAEPQNLLAEIARVAKPRGAILLRDLRRPSRIKYPFHVRWHGRRYAGTMNKLFRDSVRAAYTVPELQRLLDASPLRGVRVFRHGSTHIGLERPYNW